MKIAFPAEIDKGFESIVYNHFGSANFFIIVDSETDDTEVVLNQDLGHQHGKCQPLKALGGKNIDVVVVGGIGGTAMTKLKKSGAKIFKAVDGTVKENLELFNSGKLVEFMPFEVCGGHAEGADGCGHH
jgi:predicted Fe-Mo cluster-binding NifX family protein